MTHAARPCPGHLRDTPGHYQALGAGLRRPLATLSMDVREDAGLSSGLPAEAELVRPRRRHRARRRRSAHPLRAPRGPCRRRHQPQGARLLRRRQHHDASRSPAHGWKVNFCKFTNETRLAIEDASQHSGISVPCRRSTAPARAAGTSWRWPATRSCWSTTAIPPSACPRRRCSVCCQARAD